MKTVSFCTLGCKVNQYETEAMITLFKDAGYEISDFGEKCDIYVINTCMVTGTGERKSRQMINRAHQKNPDALIAVVGCYSQIAPEKVSKTEGVDIVLGTKDRHLIVELVEKHLCKTNNKTQSYVEDIMKERQYEELWITSYEDKTRAFVKIEEGCTEFCSYCIIPYARGPVRSRPLESIKKEALTLSKNGYTEIVLTGIHIGSYGRDLPSLSLIDAINTVSETEGIERVRLGSVEPRVLTEDFVKEISKNPKVCDHFHISLQSGCDKTLKAMNRKYTTNEYRMAVKRLRDAFDNPAITTDIITGFPGETREDFETTLDFVKEIAFSEVHVFPFSPRSGTKAADMDNQIEKKEREARAKELIAVANELHKEYINSFLGKKYDVLFEQKCGDGMYEGHMTNYIKVKVKSETNICHKTLPVVLKKYDSNAVEASLTI
ncbi:MAG: tRNA (N(6)-L-threonylcarbamoyladenosine(37)-C(2))-methylthiotransferase MtaB [Clostridia bacterium]|nr:tRNA (N(6)-L-threonylcarbamoyladenosine(37)-C(2))-methylthiotransferase MtaB [Clostridia bacterium]